MSTLEVTGIRKHFGGVEVLRDVTLSAPGGRVTAVIGPNGAGKSTLANVISGLIASDGGRVEIDGRDITTLKAYKRARLGLGRTFQNLPLFAGMTVRENVLLGAFRHTRTEKADHDDQRARVATAITALNLSGLAERTVDELDFGHAKLVEPARLLAMEPSILIMDEPAAGLGGVGVSTIGPWITERARAGIAVILIEHNMRLVMEVADYIYVLDHGVLIAEGTPAEVRVNPVVLTAYLGHEQPGEEDA